MKNKIAMTCVVFGALLGSAAAIAGDDSNAVGTSTAVFVKIQSNHHENQDQACG